MQIVKFPILQRLLENSLKVDIYTVANGINATDGNFAPTYYLPITGFSGSKNYEHRNHFFENIKSVKSGHQLQLLDSGIATIDAIWACFRVSFCSQISYAYLRQIAFTPIAIERSILMKKPTPSANTTLKKITYHEPPPMQLLIYAQEAGILLAGEGEAAASFSRAFRNLVSDYNRSLNRT